jgi:hypothetical protein
MEKTSLIADELGDLRALIKTLKTRESELRRRILDRRPNAPLEGARFTVRLRENRHSRFDAALLPASIRSDPLYHRTKTTTYVTALPVKRADQNMK